MEQNLPDTVTEIFGDEYGTPMSTTRLRKVAHLLAGNSTLKVHDLEKFQYAINDWEGRFKIS